MEEPNILPPCALDVFLGFRLDALAECVVNREEIPVLAAARHHRGRRGVAGRPGVVDPLDGVGRAGLAGEIGARGGRREERHAAIAQQRVDGEANGRVRHVDDGVDALDIEPFARDCIADVGLVLVIGIDDLDLDALAAAVEILSGHARGLDRAHAVGVLENAGDVVEHADAHDIVRDLGICRAANQARGQRKRPLQVLHCSLPCRICCLR
ncbi:hypothetical protein ACVWZK_000581 [Bradyrhizobium sp. GM0.4]